MVVLVHGAWSGGEVWSSVRAHVEAAGVDVLAPTLAGCGPAADVQTSLSDVVNDLCDRVRAQAAVTLVGHSWSGLVVSLAAARLTNVSQLVLVKAFEPVAGAALVDAFGAEAAAAERQAIAANDGWWMPPTRRELGRQAGLSPKLADDLSEWLVPQSGRTVTERVDDVPHLDVEIERWPEDGWPVDPGHWPMLSVPGLLSRWILDVVEGAGERQQVD